MSHFTTSDEPPFIDYSVSWAIGVFAFYRISLGLWEFGMRLLFLEAAP